MCTYIQRVVFLVQTPNRLLLFSKSQKETNKAVDTDSWRVPASWTHGSVPGPLTVAVTSPRHTHAVTGTGNCTATVTDLRRPEQCTETETSEAAGNSYAASPSLLFQNANWPRWFQNTNWPRWLTNYIHNNREHHGLVPRKWGRFLKQVLYRNYQPLCPLPRCKQKHEASCLKCCYLWLGAS